MYGQGDAYRDAQETIAALRTELAQAREDRDKAVEMLYLAGYSLDAASPAPVAKPVVESAEVNGRCLHIVTGPENPAGVNIGCRDNQHARAIRARLMGGGG